MAYALLQNYPNPFNPSTTIRYGLPSRSHVTLTVFNTLGQQVAALVQGEQEAGYHEAVFDAAGLSSGVYLYGLTAGDFVQTRELVLVRRIHPPQGKERAWQSAPGSTISNLLDWDGLAQVGKDRGIKVLDEITELQEFEKDNCSKGSV